MATLPERIDPQSPSESPVPAQTPGVHVPSVEPTAPDLDVPDTAPPDITPDQFSG